MHPASPTSEWRDHLRAFGAPGLAAALVVVLHAAWVFVGWPAGGHRALVSDVAFALAFVAPAVGALLNARRTDDWRERRAWRLLAASYLALAAANAVWLGGRFASGAQLSLVGKWLVSLSYVPLFIGLGSFPMAPRRRDARLRSALDVGAVVLSAGLIVWYSIGRSSSASSSLLGYLPATADVGVIAMIVLLLMRAPDRRMRAVLGLMAGGHLISVLAGLASVVVQRSVTRPHEWVDVLWMTSDALIFCGTIYRTSTHEREEAQDRSALPGAVHVIPYLLVALGMALLVLVTRARWSGDEKIVVLGMLGTTALVVARQIVSLSDHRRLSHEQVALEQRLSEVQRLETVGRLAGGVAHDFNNVLAAIQCHATLIREESALDDRRREAAQEIEHAIGRASGLTRQLLAFSRRQVLREALVDLSRVVRDTNRLFRPLIGSGIMLEEQLAAPRLTIVADEGQIGQVVMNLVANACEAMADGGTLTIRTAPVDVNRADPVVARGVAAGTYAVLTVADTGVGMSNEVARHLYEPFFTTKSLGEGTGLGLATVFGIVTHARGAILVDTAVGVGTTVTIYLPLVVDGAPQDSTRAAPAIPARRSEGPQITDLAGAEPTPTPQCVLVVDDDPSVLRSVVRLLLREGYRVLSAGHGKAALEVAAQHDGTIDLLLTDMRMPVMDGTELIAVFETRYPGTPVVRMSGYAEDGEVRATLSNPDIPFLAKPFTLDALASVVRTSLAGGVAGGVA